MMSPTISARVATAYTRANKCRDSRTSNELQTLVLHIGERLLRYIPHHDILEPALDEASLVFSVGNPHERLAKIARLAGVFLEFDTLGYAKLTHVERHNCRALVARHDAAEGPGNHILDFATGN